MGTITLADDEATQQFGRALAVLLARRALVCLQGDLGAGKTTLCRGILAGLGHTGPVKSPTFTLVEPYQVGSLDVFHIDLYRLGSAEELEYVGIDEYFSQDCLCLVEWPEKGAGWLPRHDLWIRLERSPDGRLLTWGDDCPLGKEISRVLIEGKLLRS